ncbi:methyltransferase-like protein 16 [Limulus polyphemus]|uniref:U6 small nuclear RNA (adenine-(43)-N(6))-methyltransferase n=1 Tax=Limulus polyphemus TaxID=6850 RepID=A0ABM1B0R2_LIMPO|nr:methyltransferase-like protein 16 [Limulus polyphemus]XP_013772416.1 methyltransferase-like protein 16 [Limulus polyphemus]
MSLNRFMHPRNIYRTPPDFKELAVTYPEFRRHVKQELSGKISLDFQDPAALRALSKTLLHKDFDLEVDLPSDRLIPALPQRLNYILWVEDLLEIVKEDSASDVLEGVDIGTGASCIIPLIACRKNKWKFVATEVDAESISLAQKNVDNNGLKDSIQIIQTESGCVLKEVVEEVGKNFDFCFCNPPFFRDQWEANPEGKSRTPNRPPPISANSASDVEKVTEGGEVEFVRKMIQDSLALGTQVRVYTTMLGKKKSLKIIKNELRKQKVEQFTTTEFCQGRTMRWGVAWTFMKGVDIKKAPTMKHEKPKPPLIYIIPNELKETEYSLSEILSKIKGLMEELKITYQVTHEGKHSVHISLHANENTWSHQRRKKRKLIHKQKLANSKEEKIQHITNAPISEHSKQETLGSSSLLTAGNNQDSGEIKTKSKTEEYTKKICEKDNDSYTVEDSKNLFSKDLNGCKTHMEKEETSYDIPEDQLFTKDKHSFQSSSDVNSVALENTSDSKREEESNFLSQQAAKKQKMESTSSEATDSSGKEGEISTKRPRVGGLDVPGSYLLNCDLQLKKEGNMIILKLLCKDGASGREPMHQVLQFIKNRLK